MALAKTAQKMNDYLTLLIKYKNTNQETMDIKSSLKITEQYPNYINFITTGSFVHVYNQSFYLLTEKLNHSLTPSVKYVKSAGNRFVVSSGFPKNRLEELYPTVIKTAWGFQLETVFNLIEYGNWLNQWQARARWQQASLLSSSQNLAK